MEARKLDDIKEETFYLDPGHQNSPTPDLAIVEEIVAHLTRYREKEKKESRSIAMRDENRTCIPGFSQSSNVPDGVL